MILRIVFKAPCLFVAARQRLADNLQFRSLCTELPGNIEEVFYSER